MEELSNKPEEGVGLTNNQEGNPEGQAQTESEGVIEVSKYKSLESEYTRNRQNLIKAEVRLAKADPSRIKELQDDVKLQNAVIKEVYGLANLSELRAVYGENFSSPIDGVDEDDEVSVIKRELNLLKFKASVSESEKAMVDFKASNPHFFSENDAEEKIREKMDFISSSLPASERIAMAARLAFGTVTDPKKSAFKELSNATPSGGANPAAPTTSKEDKKKTNEEALKDFFASIK